MDWQKGYYQPSELHLTFVNGYTRVYNLKVSPWKHITTEIEWINEVVEFERSLAAQDDELEDDQ